MNDEGQTKMKQNKAAAIKRSFLPVVVKQVDEKERSFWAVASTEAEDRMGDIIRVDGWQLENYKKNPVLLWAHDYSQPPVGKVVEVRVDKENKQLLFKAQFATADVYEFADTIFKLFKAGHLNAFSVGFSPIEWAQMKEKEEKGTISFGVEYIKQELLEISCVPVPANFEALAECGMAAVMAKSFKAPDDNEEVAEEPQQPPEEPAPDVLGTNECAATEQPEGTGEQPAAPAKEQITPEAVILSPITAEMMKSFVAAVESAMVILETLKNLNTTRGAEAGDETPEQKQFTELLQRTKNIAHK